MQLKLKNKKILFPLSFAIIAIPLFTTLIIFVGNFSFNTLDYKLIDSIYESVITSGKGPEISDKVTYLNITNDTYKSMGSNYLNRNYLAGINNIFSNIGPEGIMYDIVFPHPSNKEADSNFSESIVNAGNIYLPIAFKLAENPDTAKFRWRESHFFDLLRNDFTSTPEEYGDGSVPKAIWALTQFEMFAEQAHKSGHINSLPDPDGIYRHHPLFIRVDSLLFPTVTFAMYLDYNGIPKDSIKIYWGNEIVIPASTSRYLPEDIRIPIDDEGRVFIPYPNFWGSNLPFSMEAHNLIINYRNPDKFDELLDHFEGNFVFIGDVSPGISDLGQTPLESDVPLVAIHAALMNAFLTNNFYNKWSDLSTALLIFLAGIILGFSTFPKSNLWMYFTTIIIILGTGFLTLNRILDFNLIPVTTILSSFIFMFLSYLVLIQILSAHHETFIKDAFAKYVPKEVVDEMLDKPNLLQLGGEERELSIIFSDIANFTSISEKIEPGKLVALLNNYLTEMTTIILNNRGIVDKFLGDGILAEFGAPLYYDDHADAAVHAAMQMQNKLKELNNDWRKKGYPEITCRVGVNTGRVIVGNMGSNQVFDYTVVGDPVNLASRLEGANKKYNTNIMISESTFNELTENVFRTRPLDIIKVKGKSNAVVVYEVIGYMPEEIDSIRKSYYDNYETGFRHFQKTEIEEAEKCFIKSLELLEGDPASVELLKRINDYKANPHETWDGARIFYDK
ncbi:MAG: adenylate/guanylate cyclase domain-containing protein [Melioribacteraceae bacterium]|nr:adenylate/guanylate cyclase domain-containing protein [Melioribacteraceae bacterium]MCF8356149.1 adenylate/guanylate cyclase domain-containing protein [Melioribacteraceae bacterium]MCF8395621.1 adenylate/guanylate cyclase domain-containing protein [Melioribacteraceae bacterium]MCF8420872.1 adenylate/guanylate cyclase domain-containing protein [Melioribacteraceae bacterium]